MPADCCKDKWPTIIDDEPVFVLRGRDKFTADTVRYWLSRARIAGVNQVKITRANEHLDAIERYQTEHPERCKIPD